MHIFEQEHKDGLSDRIFDDKVRVACKLITDIPEATSAQLAISRKQFLEKTDAEVAAQLDLFPLYTIMVSTGANGNDDVFTKGETWAARCTPEDKPFNLEHEPRRIIGHITGNAVVDNSLNIIPIDAPVEVVPEQFHILTSAVIYRHLKSRDPELEMECTDLIESIKRNEWSVSMEALFGDFDYALFEADGTYKHIQRNIETAFLTKYLRIYGGGGVYLGKRLGRILKNITFSGKGLVRQPANPNSVIFTDVTVKGVFANMQDIEINIHGDKNMADETVNETAAKLTELEAAKANLSTELDNMKSKVVDLEKIVAERDTTIAELNTKLVDSGVSLASMTTERDTLLTSKTEIEKSLEAAKAELAKIQADAAVANRIQTLLDNEFDQSEADEFMANFGQLDDAMFAKMVETVAKKVKKAKCAKTEKCMDDEESEGKCGKDKKAKSEASEETVEEDKAGETAATSEVLDNVEKPEDKPLVTDENKEQQLQESRAALVSYFDSLIHKNQKR